MSAQDNQGGAASADAGLDPALTRLAIVLAIGSFASLMDSTIVSVAINTFSRTFHAPLSTMQWVITGYLLALAMVIPLTGWAIERYGAKTMWMVSITMFLVSSVLAGAAWSAPSLIAFRVVQGLGGGMTLPIAQSMLVQAAGPGRIGRVMSFIGMPAQLAPIVGPLIGGVIVESLSWRWIFYINVPICLIALVLSARYVLPSERRPGQKLDIVGVTLLSPGMAALVYGLSEAGSSAHGFSDGTAITWLSVGAALLILYIFHSLRVGASAIIDIRLFRVRSFSAASALMFLFGVSLFGAMFLLPLYYTEARGQGPLAAGLLLAPQGLGAMLAMFVVGKVADRVNSRLLIMAGLVVATVATIPFAFVGHNLNDVLLGIALLIRGLGLGVTVVPMSAVAYLGLGHADVPRATSAVNITMRVGASFGVAILAIILQRQIADHAADAAGHGTAFGNTFIWSLVLTAVALVAVLFIPGKPAATKQAVGDQSTREAGDVASRPTR